MRLVAMTLGLSLALGCSPAPTDDPDGVLSDELSMPADPTLSHTEFDSPQECGGCHTRHYAEWKTSMHSYSMTDPVYRELVYIRQADFGGLQDKFCLQCHSPIATRGGEIEPGFNFDDLSERAREGITCDTCHKISDTERLFNAGFVLDSEGPIRGPIRDPQTGGAHEAEYSPLFEQSAICGTCHDVVEVNGLNLERPYEEWRESPAMPEGQTCQDCHMPSYEGSAAPGAPTRTLHEHRWVGVDLPLADGYLTATEYDDLRERIATLLAGAGTVVVESAPTVVAGGQLDLHVTIKNNIPAHNLPTGSTFNRQLWLELTATDATGRVLYQTGQLDDNGDLRSHFSTLDPYGDPDLISLGSTFVDQSGTPVKLSWRAAEHFSTALSPLYDRTHTLFVPAPVDVVGPISVSARLRFRSHAPHLLRDLKLDELVPRLEIFEVDSTSVRVDVVP